MIDFESIVNGTIGGAVALILHELYATLKKKYFNNRPRLLIDVDLNNPVSVILGNKANLTFMCHISVKNASSLDAYHVYFMLPKKEKPFKIETASGDFDHLKCNGVMHILCARSIEVDIQKYEEVKSDHVRLHSFNPFNDSLKFALGYANAENQKLFSLFKDQECIYKRFKPFKMKAYNLKALLN